MARFQPRKREGLIYTMGTPVHSGCTSGWSDRPGPAGPVAHGVSIPVLDLAMVYQQDARGQWQAQTAGDTLAVSSWPEPGATRCFASTCRPARPATCARAAAPRHAHQPARAADHDTAHGQRIQMGMGLGIMARAGAADRSLPGAIVGVRDAAYAWYSAYASIMTLAVAAIPAWQATCYGAAAVLDRRLQGVLAVLAGRRSAAVRAASGRSVGPPGLAGPAGGLDGLVWRRTGGCVPGFHPKPVGLVSGGVYVGMAAVTNIWIARLAWRRRRVGPVGAGGLHSAGPVGVAGGAAHLRAAAISGRYLCRGAGAPLAGIAAPAALASRASRSRERHGGAGPGSGCPARTPLTGPAGAHTAHDRLRQVVARCKPEGPAGRSLVLYCTVLLPAVSWSAA